jgi:hypothetical protein
MSRSVPVCARIVSMPYVVAMRCIVAMRTVVAHTQQCHCHQTGKAEPQTKSVGVYEILISLAMADSAIVTWQQCCHSGCSNYL